MILVNDKPVTPIVFPNGEIRFDVKDLLPTPTTRIKVTLRFENNSELMELFFLKKHLDAGQIHPTPVDLIMPYIPYSRMDRTEGIEVFTLKYFADFINGLNFRYVQVLEPHSNVSLALFDRLLVSSLSDLGMVSGALTEIHAETGEMPTLIYPDAGAMKRYAGEHAGHHKGVFLYAEKTRNFRTGKITSLTLIGKKIPEAKVALIVDDLSSYGGTFLATAEALKEAGFEKVYLLIAHAENVIRDGSLLEADSPIDHVFTTDSIFNGSHPKMTVNRIYNPLV